MTFGCVLSITCSEYSGVRLSTEQCPYPKTEIYVFVMVRINRCGTSRNAAESKQRPILSRRKAGTRQVQMIDCSRIMKDRCRLLSVNVAGFVEVEH